MRLTLRTMLAYLDDVLSEADAHELGQKIESSDFATGLVHRIRNSISRLRLSSPDLLGNDSMDDPNTVAEFIDSSLSPEKEQEFEKVCLQSDKHLAEVASCHQILTLVLGTPARVEPRLRDRIYRTGIPGAGAATTASISPGGTSEPFRRIDLADAAHATDDPPVEIRRPRRLSDSNAGLAEFGARRNLWPIVAAVIIGFLLTGGFMVAMGPLDSGHPLAGLLGLRDVEMARNPSTSEEQPTVEPQLPPSQTQTESASMLPPAPPAPPSTSPLELSTADFPQQGSFAEPHEQPAVPAKEWVIPESEDSIAEPSNRDLPREDELSNNDAIDAIETSPEFDVPEVLDPATDAFGDPQSDAIDNPQSDALPVDDVPDELGIRDPFKRNSLDSQPNVIADVVPVEIETNDPPMPDREIGIPGLDVTPRVLDEEVANSPIDVESDVIPVDSPTVAPADLPEVAPAEQLLEIGRFFSEDQVLLYWDEQVSAWLRVPPRTAFRVGHRLRTLEVFRPQLLLAPGNIQVAARGNSEIVFGEPIDAQTPTLEVPFGRLLLNSTGRPNSRIALQTGQRLTVIDLTEPDSEVVCQVRPVLLPGLDPREEVPHRLVQLWVTRGSAKIVAQDKELQVDMGNQYAFADDREPRVTRFQEVPGWLHNRVGEVDRDAAAELETLLAMGRDVVLSLSETADSRRTDVRSLAVRYLVALEQYRVGASLFSIPDRKHQFTWPALFEELQAAIARGPESASAVLETFESLYGADGEKLYRMLLGYDDVQLQEGAADQLVDDLDNPRVEFRILAFQNLQRMTQKSYMYGPIQSEKNRSNKITKWRNELRKGKVTNSHPSEDFVDWQRLSFPGRP